MVRIGIRELRQHASRYIARVRAGETVEVTDRGVLVALMVPPDPRDAVRQDLIARGRLQPASAPRSIPERRAVGTRTQAALDDVRGERL